MFSDRAWLAIRRGLVAALVAAAGCGDGPPELTCEVIADPQNCWAATAAAIAECLPPGDVGVLAADRRSCQFSGDVAVRFDEPLPERTEDVTALEDLAFSIETVGGASVCGRVVDTLENRVELEAGALGATAQLHPDRRFELSCADGSRFEAPFDRLFECAAEGAPPPTDGFEITPTSVTFSISSATTPGALFQCRSL